MKKFRRSIYDSKHTFLRNWLVTKRQEANLSQRQLAEELEVVHSVIGKVEKGERRLDVIEFIDYCRALNIDPCEYIKLDSKTNS